MKIIIKPFLLLTAIAALVSCNRKPDPFNWKTQILTPLVKAELTVEDLAGEETEIQVNGDETVSIVYSEKIYSYTPDTLVPLNVDPFVKSVKIDQLQLSDINVVENITMGELLDQQNFPPIDNFPIFISEPDSTIDVSFGPIEADFSEYVTTALLSGGTAEISLENQFPLDIRDITIEIRNQSSGDLIETLTFNRINSGETATRTIDLAGKRIEGVLEMYVANATIEMKSFFLRRSDYLEARINIFDIQVEEATAIFPAQQIVNNTDQVELQDLDDVIIDETIVDKGFVSVIAYSTIEEELYLTYEIPTATLNGVPFQIDVTVPPAPPGGVSTVDLSYSFDGYHIALTNNSFDNTIIGSIDSSGVQRTITKQDSVYVNLQIEELKPACIKGYLGQQNIHVGPEVTSIDIMDKLNVNNISFDRATMELRVENLIGATANIDVQQLTATNTNNSSTVTLSPTPPTLLVNRATDTLNSTSTILTLDETNYNTPAMINVLPNNITYELDINTNPTGNAGNIDFAYKGYGLDAYMDLEIPLSFEVNGMVLRDTIDFIKDGAKLPVGIENGELTFAFDNSFPLESDIELYFLDQNEVAFDSLSFENIEAASLDASTRRVDESMETRFKKVFEADRLDAILDAKFLYMRAQFDTAPTSEHLKIYEDYTLEVKIIGDFIYHANKP